MYCSAHPFSHCYCHFYEKKFSPYFSLGNRLRNNSCQQDLLHSYLEFRPVQGGLPTSLFQLTLPDFSCLEIMLILIYPKSKVFSIFQNFWQLSWALNYNL